MSKRVSIILLILAASLILTAFLIGAWALSGIYSTSEPTENEIPMATMMVHTPVPQSGTGVIFSDKQNFTFVTIA